MWERRWPTAWSCVSLACLPTLTVSGLRYAVHHITSHPAGCGWRGKCIGRCCRGAGWSQRVRARPKPSEADVTQKQTWVTRKRLYSKNTLCLICLQTDSLFEAPESRLHLVITFLLIHFSLKHFGRCQHYFISNFNIWSRWWEKRRDKKGGGGQNSQ